MHTLAIVPARAGSKGVANKNVAVVGGRPLIEWTILAARTARSIDRVIVTTDSEAIADVARGCQAQVPFMRPPEFARDETPGMDPILHVVRWLAEQEGYEPGVVVCLQPTSPLRNADDIDAAMDLLRETNGDAVVSVTLADHHPHWMKKRDPATGALSDWMTVDRPAARKQDLPPVHYLNGAIYLARRELLLQHQSWYSSRTFDYVMPPERALDIDTAWDLYLADLVLTDTQSTHD